MRRGCLRFCAVQAFSLCSVLRGVHAGLNLSTGDGGTKYEHDLEHELEGGSRRESLEAEEVEVRREVQQQQSVRVDFTSVCASLKFS